VYDTPDYTEEDMVKWEAEVGCSICFMTYGGSATNEAGVTPEALTSGLAEPNNPIVHCKSCDIGVHPRCFGERITGDFTRKFRCSNCLFESQ
jgi:hypothetical protein